LHVQKGVQRDRGAGGAGSPTNTVPGPSQESSGHLTRGGPKGGEREGSMWFVEEGV